MSKDIKEYKYCICDGVLVVYAQGEGLAYFGEFNEEDEAEDTLNELCEEGVLCPTANLVEVQATALSAFMKKFFLK